jgi:diguanylate cyclase (GGDEF)-like protein
MNASKSTELPGCGDRLEAPPQARRVAGLIRGALILAVAPVVIVALALHEIASQREAQRSQNRGVEFLARAISLQWRAGASAPEEEPKRTCQRLLSQPPILAAAAFDPQHKLLAQTACSEDLLPLLTMRGIVPVPDGVPVTLVTPTAISTEFPWVQRVVVNLGPQFKPDRPERLVLLVGALYPAPGTAKWFWYGAIVITAMGCMFLANNALGRRIVAPVSRLLASTASPRLDLDAGDPTDDVDEFGMLARSLNELKGESFHWRGQAERIERRMAFQIASETREMSRDLKRVKREAWLDPLTRVNNRRMLEEQLPTIFAAHRDAHLDLSAVMLDLDHFKRLNDERGHQTGDEILIFLGELLRQCLRSADIAVRFGGDEFVLILPGVFAEEAAALTKRLMCLFAQRVKVMLEGPTIPGISAGIASLGNNHPQTPHDLLAAADQALYRRKIRPRVHTNLSLV